MNLPDLAKHRKDRFGQRKRPLLIALADDAKDHLLRVDRRDGQFDRLADPQTVGVHQREAATVDGLLKSSNQAAAIRVARNVGQPLLPRVADFF